MHGMGNYEKYMRDHFQMFTHTDVPYESYITAKLWPNTQVDTVIVKRLISSFLPTPCLMHSPKQKHQYYGGKNLIGGLCQTQLLLLLKNQRLLLAIGALPKYCHGNVIQDTVFLRKIP